MLFRSRVNEWEHSSNRIWDFGKSGSPCMRLHRNGGTTLRFAINSIDTTDDSDFWSGEFGVGEDVHIAVTLSATGGRTIYRNGSIVAQANSTAISSISWPTDASLTVGKNLGDASDTRPHMTVRDAWRGAHLPLVPGRRHHICQLMSSMYYSDAYKRVVWL